MTSRVSLTWPAAFQQNPLHLPRCCAARQLTIASLVLSPRCLPTTNQRHTRDRHPARLRKSNGWATARYRSPVGRRPNCRSSSRSSSRPRPGDPTLTPQQEGLGCSDPGLPVFVGRGTPVSTYPSAQPSGPPRVAVMVVVRRLFLRLIHDRGLGGIGLQHWSRVIR